jgi:hypothetical protein
MDISGRENVTKEMELWDSCLKGISFDWTAFSLVISIKNPLSMSWQKKLFMTTSLNKMAGKGIMWVLQTTHPLVVN